MNSSPTDTERTAPGGVAVQRFVRPGHVFHFKNPVCPYCGGKLTAMVNGWVKQDDGWVADDLQLDCENDDETHDDHCYMPYEYWLPVEQQILRWMNARYRWNIEGPNNRI